MSGALAAGCDYQALPALEGPLPDAGADAPPDAPMDPPPPVMWASCQGLPKTCGPTGTDDCCNPASTVTGGTYYRSYDLAGDSYSGNQNAPATVSTFRLDKYEVTVGRFRAFVNAGKGTQASPPAPGSGAHAKIPGSGWDASWNASLPVNRAALISAVKCDSTFQTWTDSPGANESRPMNCLTWYAAMAFCIWDGGYLPTEAEWNYAAAGGSEQRAYPWSSPAGSLTINDSRASYHDGTSCVGDGMSGCAVTDYVRVGSKPMGDGRWGQSELAGNVEEWTLESFGAVSPPYSTPCNDCARLVIGERRITRGGNALTTSNVLFALRSGYRNSGNPVFLSATLGVRCARVP